MTYTRRQFVRIVPAFGAFAMASPVPDSLGQGAHPADPPWPAPPPARGLPVDDFFPSHHPALVKEMVTVSHFNVARVRELLQQHPELAKAAWDWGYGDWETALGAASHTGNRAIAELLLGRGAPPTHFSATMLGQLDVLKSFVAASPGLQTMRGPHGLTLMVHARLGGPQAAAVVSYLESIGGADQPYRNEPLTDAERAALAGVYTFGDRPRDSFVVNLQKSALMIARVGTVERALFHQGQHAFHAAGGPGTTIRFERDGDRVVALTVHDPDVVVKAKKSA
ncbi:MAG TPA: hypothetical protein VKD69_02055 [Vicinamibacterales bacterium]|nr:hypothetical protein [Vicinamibacterales bacterium]